MIELVYYISRDQGYELLSWPRQPVTNSLCNLPLPRSEPINVNDLLSSKPMV